MGSLRGKDDPLLGLPFGFSISDMAGLPFDTSPGASILNPEESRYINDFMSSVMNNNTDWCLPELSEGLNFADHVGQWYSGPEVVAHGTSYGTAITHPQFVNGGSSAAYDYISPSSVTTQPLASELNASADVLAAATALSRPSRVDVSSYNPSPPLTTPTGPIAPMGPPVGNNHQFTFSAFGLDEGNGMTGNNHQTFMSESIFGESTNPPIRRQHVPQTQVQYGSDPNFNRTRFEPRTWDESLDGLVSEQSAIIRLFQRNDSAAPTRTSSPVRQNAAPQVEAAPRTHQNSPPSQPIDLGAAVPVKKRKISQAVDDPTDREEVVSCTPAKRKAPPTEGEGPARVSPTSTTPNGGSTRRRRKSAQSSAAPKPPRENLTEEQKRENHIKSEQKRRGHIKAGFAELKRVVPAVGLGSGGGHNMSKAGVLELTGNWVEELKRDNDRLQAQLDKLLESESS